MDIVADSSPLISLAMLNKLFILEHIFDEILIPMAVYDEITKINKPHFKELKEFATNRVKKIQNILAVQLLQKELDTGEAEAIVLAIENNITDILIDEYKGRKIAKVQNLSPIGTIGVLLQSKNKGLLKEVKPELDKLIANHQRISKELYNTALKLANEA